MPSATNDPDPFCGQLLKRSYTATLNVSLSVAPKEDSPHKKIALPDLLRGEAGGGSCSSGMPHAMRVTSAGRRDVLNITLQTGN